MDIDDFWVFLERSTLGDMSARESNMAWRTAGALTCSAGLMAAAGCNSTSSLSAAHLSVVTPSARQSVTVSNDDADREDSPATADKIGKILGLPATIS